MTKLPRWQPTDKVTGADLNFILGILDTADVATHSSATNSGVTGGDLNPVTPVVTGSITPGGAPTLVRGLTGSYGIDNFSQSHTAYVLLSWTPNPISDFISRYDIYYHKGSDPTLYNLSVGGDVNSLRVNNLFPGNIYSFAIQAHDAANRSSSWSPEVNVAISPDADPPAIPTSLTATATGTGVYLTWTEVGPEGISNDLKQYSVAVSLDGGATYPNAYTTGPGNSFFYTPTTANQGTVFFQIATIDWTGNLSAYSGAVSASVGTLLGPITIVGDYGTIGDSLTLKSLTGGAKGGYLAFSDAGTTKWELGKEASNALQLYDNARGAAAVLFNSNSSINVTPVTNFANGVVLGSGNTGLVAPDIHSDGSNVYIEAVAGNSIKLRPGGANVSTSEATVDGSGNFTIGGSNLAIAGATSLFVPGATSLSLRNHANNADNLLITDAGDLTARLSLTAPYLKTTGAPSLGSGASGRYVGRWTTQGPPTGLTSVTGDFGFDTSGVIWYCTSGGSPGTWLASPFSGVTAVLQGATETTASTTPVDLTTVGPSITLNTGTQVMIAFSSQCASTTTANAVELVGCAVTGATTITATADGSHILKLSHATVNGIEQAGITYALGGLTAGSNTFTLKYWVNAGTGQFANRLLTIWPA